MKTLQHFAEHDPEYKHLLTAKELEKVADRYAPKPDKTVKAFEAARAEIARQVEEASQ